MFFSLECMGQELAVPKQIRMLRKNKVYEDLALKSCFWTLSMNMHMDISYLSIIWKIFHHKIQPHDENDGIGINSLSSLFVFIWNLIYKIISNFVTLLFSYHLENIPHE